MDAAGLGLATLDLCIKLGKQLWTVCQEYHHADRELREQLLYIESIWLRTERQIEAIRELWSSLDGHVQVHYNHVLNLLHHKLQLAANLVNELDNPTDDKLSSQVHGTDLRQRVTRLKYAVYAKKDLARIIADLDHWRESFDPSWYLLVRAGPPVIEQAIPTTPEASCKEILIIQQLRHVLRTNVEPPTSGESIFLPWQYTIQVRREILNTSTQVGSASGQDVIVDSLQIAAGNNIQIATKDVRDIARILAQVDPMVFGLLKCQGVVKIYDSSQVTGFEFIFALPRELSHPQSLRTFLLTADPRFSLDGRFRLARLLARSVSLLHSAQLVHKNISPETILLLEDLDNKLVTPFLVGFQKFHRLGGHTYLMSDTLWEKNLYRHPKRQGSRPEEEYKMQHDIYSLGVCLLEIGLGITFVCCEATSVSNESSRSIVPNQVLEIAEYINWKDVKAKAFQIKKRLVALAQEQLPGKMGNLYTDVVLSCLTCLDPNNQGFGDENDFTDEDGVLVGVRYIEKVLNQIEEIRF